MRWSEVASKLLGLRTGKQCRERWYNHLHPSLKKSPWTEDEDERLIELQKSLGNSWSKISQSLPGRRQVISIYLFVCCDAHGEYFVVKMK